MKDRVNIITCVLLLGALTAPAAQADRRAPVTHHHATSVTKMSVLSGLGHEGSGLTDGRRLAAIAAVPQGVFTGLGHEGSGLVDTRRLEANTVTPNPFTGLGHEGGGLFEE
jgi:hypothetical protein